MQSVLVVDDEEANRAFIKLLLVRMLNCEVVEAVDGQQALELLTGASTSMPDLIMLDVLMPGLSGFEVAEKIRGLPAAKEVPIIFLSGMNESSSKLKGFELGAVDYITKPFNKDELLARLRVHLQLKQYHDREKDRLKALFGRYVTKEVADEILNKKLLEQSQSRICTLMFTDIKNYTTMSEGLKAGEIVNMLNDYFTDLVEIIGRNKGIVNKFIGDAALALFNVPIDDPDHAVNAVRAGMEVARFFEKKTYGNGIPLVTKVGINTGVVTVGNIGSRDRKEYTVIGDAVNVAARLETLNGEYGTLLLVGEESFQLARDTFEGEHLGDIKLKGKQQTTGVYRIVTPESGS